ncbi:MAG TPA: hypothetical protein ENN54_02325, partial [Thermoplasmatales archaeon]|nr:hypothetical protein [Thermoplasmatales archaeon]
MIFPSPMSRVAILTHQRHSDALVERLHQAGLMEISQTRREEVAEGRMHPQVDACASRELRLTRILDILKKYEQKKKGLRAALRPSLPEKRPVHRCPLEEKLAEAEEVLEDIESFIIDAEERIEDIDRRLDDLEDTEDKVRLLAPLDIDLSWLGTSRYVVVRAGVTTDREALLQSAEGTEVTVLSAPAGGDRETWAVLLVAHVDHQEELRAVRPYEELEVTGKGFPPQMLEHLAKEKRELKKKRRGLIQDLQEIYRSRKSDILAIREEIQLEKQRREIPERFGTTSYTVLIEGWCLAGHAERLREAVEEVTGGQAAFSAREMPREGNQAPIHLAMPRWAASFRTFLELFALPKYDEINPALFLGISLILFFAIMLGDAGYGLLIFIISLWAYLRLGPYSSTVKNWSFLGLWMGLSTVVAGFLFNGFFGDFIPRFVYGNPDATLYQASVLGYSLPIDALHKPLVILVMTLIIGLAHLNLGIVLAAYQNYKRGRVKAAVVEQGG